MPPAPVNTMPPAPVNTMPPAPVNTSSFSPASLAAFNNAASLSTGGSWGTNGNTQTFTPTTTRTLTTPTPVTPYGGVPTPVTTNGRTLYNPQAGTGLASGLENSFEASSPYQSILSSYNAAGGATGAQYQASGNQLGTQYGQDIQQQGQNNRISLDNAMTSRGLATNTALLAQQQDQANYSIKNIRDQMSTALASNNTSAAAKLADLAAQEQSSITNARTAFLNNYFQSQTEARTQAEFQTPIQKAVITLAGQYPDAGITANDTLAQAQAKVSGSALYQRGLQSTQAGITASLGSAEASRAAALSSAADAARTRTLTGFLGNASSIPQSDPGVQYLLSGGPNGGAGTVAGLQARYAGTPQAVEVPQIIAAAQGFGYNQTSADLAYQAALNKVNAQTSGNIYNWGGSVAQNLIPSIRSQVGGGNPRTAPASYPTGTTKTGPDANGNGNYIWVYDGTQWNAIGNVQ